MFAGSCIGIIILVMVLEGLRRASREYDAFITRQAASQSLSTPSARTLSDSDSNRKIPETEINAAAASSAPRVFTPSLPQQLIRALLHMCQFAVAYFVMLLAMYFNGYIIISIVSRST